MIKDPKHFLESSSSESTQTEKRLLVLSKLIFINMLYYFFSDLENKKCYNRVKKLSKQKSKQTAQNIFRLLEQNEQNIAKVMGRFINNSMNPELSLCINIPNAFYFYKELPPISSNVGAKYPYPYFLSGDIQTSPPLKSKNKYIVAILDWEFEDLQNSKLLEVHAMNLALALEARVKDKEAVGATLLIKGRVPRSFINWLRGGYPFNPSFVPNVEILYCIPTFIPESSHTAEKEEYIFCLKKGTKFRLKKNNVALKSNISKEIFQKWQSLRNFVVIDDLILASLKHKSSDSYNKFVENFWDNFSNLHSPKRDVPNWSSRDFDDDIISKFDRYKEELKNSTQAKLKKLYEKIIANKMGFNDKIKTKINELAKRVDNTNTNLIYLDWNHIIYDVVKDKKYDRPENSILIADLTSKTLDNYVTTQSLKRTSHILRIENTNKSKLTLRASYNFSQPHKINVKIDTNSAKFYSTLFNIIVVFSQFNHVTNGEQSAVYLYFENVLNQINKKYHQFFYRFLNAGKSNLEGYISFSEFDVLKCSAENKIFSWKTIDEIRVIITQLIEKCKPDDDITEDNIQKMTDILKQTPLFNQVSFNDICTLVHKYKDQGDVNLSEADIKKDLVLEKLTEQRANLFHKDSCLYFFEFEYLKINIVKLIYVIDHTGEVILAHEEMVSSSSDRPSHSELAGGYGVQAAGELIFIKKGEQWNLEVINNGSGHYRPEASKTLAMAKEIIINKMYRSIMTQNVHLLISLKQGMTLASGQDLEQEIFQDMGDFVTQLESSNENDPKYMILDEEEHMDLRPNAVNYIRMNEGQFQMALSKRFKSDSFSRHQRIELEAETGEKAVEQTGRPTPEKSPISANFSSGSLQFFQPDCSEDAELEMGREESLKLARQQNKIGPRGIEGYDLEDVPDDGNCFYSAMVKQLEMLNHEFLSNVPPGTDAKDSLRLMIQGGNYQDREWAGYHEIQTAVLKLENIVIAIIDTRTDERHRQPEYVYHYKDPNGLIQYTKDPSLLDPEHKILKLAYTGNHYLSVRQEPISRPSYAPV